MVLENGITIRRFFTLVAEYKCTFLIDQDGQITDCSGEFMYCDFLLNPVRMLNKLGTMDCIEVRVIAQTESEEDGIEIINETW